MLETILYTLLAVLSIALIISIAFANKYGWIKKETKIDLKALEELEEQQLNDALNNQR